MTRTTEVQATSPAYMTTPVPVPPSSMTSSLGSVKMDAEHGNVNSYTVDSQLEEEEIEEEKEDDGEVEEEEVIKDVRSERRANVLQQGGGVKRRRSYRN